MRNLSPITYAAAALTVASALAVAGVFLLAGAGWAMVVAAVPFLLFGLVVLRGAVEAENLDASDEAE